MVLFAVGVEGSSVAEFGLGEWGEREREREIVRAVYQFVVLLFTSSFQC